MERTTENTRKLEAAYRLYLKQYYFELVRQEEELLKDTGVFMSELTALLADGPLDTTPLDTDDDVRLVA